MWRFGAAARQTSKKSWWRRCSRHNVRICDFICSNVLRSYLTVLKLYGERISHFHDIEIIFQIILSLIASPCMNDLTSNFNRLIFFDSSHWLFHLDWLFEIRTDPEFVKIRFGNDPISTKQKVVNSSCHTQKVQYNQFDKPTKNQFWERGKITTG